MPFSLSLWSRQSRRLLHLTGPILVGQLAQTGISATDTIMAGRYGADDLAAIGIAASFWLPIYLFFVGLFMATTTLVAHCFGARDMLAALDGVRVQRGREHGLPGYNDFRESCGLPRVRLC